jgi:hypothetical protein
MTDSLNGVIKQLERQKTAIERALTALRGIEGTLPALPVSAPAKRKGGMTPAGRRRLSAALKKRWAAKKAAEAGPAATAEIPTPKGKKRSAAVRKRMKEAQRLRWARIRGESGPPAMPEPPKPKRRISAEGMKRIIAATKKRWRLQRAAAKSSPARNVVRARKAAVKKSSPAPAPTPVLAQTAG